MFIDGINFPNEIIENKLFGIADTIWNYRQEDFVQSDRLIETAMNTGLGNILRSSIYMLSYCDETQGIPERYKSFWEKNLLLEGKEKNIVFLKGNTKEHLLLFYADENLAGSVARSEVVKIKFKVDINPPEYAGFEHKYRLLQSGFISEDVECTLPELRHMLYERFDAIDFRQAKQDVEPFIRDTASLNMWNADFFKQITARLRF